MRANISKFVALSLAATGVLVILLFYTASINLEVVSISSKNKLLVGVLDDETKQLKLENEKLASELRKYQFQSTNSSDSTFNGSSPCEVIHVCIVCAGYTAARDVTTVIKSLLFYRTNILHLHFIVDTISLPILKTLLRTWAIPSVLYSFHSTSLMLNDVSWVPNFHYSGVFGLMKLQLPYTLPPSVDRVIVLDTDLVFSADITELWRYFSVFQPSQMIGLVENLSDWYLTRQRNRWPAHGRGYNTGVMLMDLQRMRENDWAKLWRQTVNKYIPQYKKTALADQDVINALIKDTNGIVVHRLPCSWNVQLTVHSTFEPLCYSTATAKVIHFNSQYKQNVHYGDLEKDLVVDSFKNVYFMFVQYDGNLLKHRSLTAECENLETNDTSTHSVIGELMDSNKKVAAACYQVDGLRQSSQGRMHLYYFPYNYTPQAEDITLVAQLGIDRLGVLELLCENWAGPMSIALYLSDSQVHQFYEFVSNSQRIKSRKNIGYHIVFLTGIFLSWDKSSKRTPLVRDDASKVGVAFQKWAEFYGANTCETTTDSLEREIKSVYARGFRRGFYLFYSCLQLFLETHYPVNYLRNVALNNAATEYVFLTDIDFVPMANMYDHLRNFVIAHKIHANKIALVVPAFETHQYRLKMPPNKEELKMLINTGQIQTFRADIWPAGHAATNYTRWYNSDMPYFISWKPNYEPYIVVSREMVPRYDERFVGFGWNKVSHIMEVDAQGFKMMVLPDAFIIHSPHAPSASISHFRSSSAYRKCVKTLKKEFQNDLIKSHGEKARKYLSEK